MALARQLKEAKAACGLLDRFDLQLVRLHLRLPCLPASGVERAVPNRLSGEKNACGHWRGTVTYRRLCSKCVTAWKGETVAVLSVPSR